jgi:hypothetical protein
MPYYDDPLVRFDSGFFYDDPGLGYSPGSPPNNIILPSSGLTGTTGMEYWEITKDRAQKTLAVWTLHVPTVKIGAVDKAAFEALIDDFEPKAQARTTAQDAFDEAVRTVKTALLKMKILGTKVPQIIEGQMPDEAGIIDDLADVFRIAPRSEPTILGRARALYPVWVRANTVMTSLTPPGAAITRAVAGVSHTATMLKALLDGFTDLSKEQDDKEAVLDQKRSDLRALDRQVDRIAKNWYQVIKNTYDPGSPVYDALASIPTEEGTPYPTAIDLNPLVQGDGLEVLATYEPGGGEHATTKAVEWMVEGVDADFTHTAELDPSGNTLGPFTVGQVVKVRTKATNSSGSTTSAVRSITITTPV